MRQERESPSPRRGQWIENRIDVSGRQVVHTSQFGFDLDRDRVYATEEPEPEPDEDTRRSPTDLRFSLFSSFTTPNQQPPMTLPRSKSAPVPLTEKDGANRPSSTFVSRASKQLEWLLDFAPHERQGGSLGKRGVHTPSVLSSPRREDGEDPFSLAGFFPSRPGSPFVNFNWMSREYEEEIEKDDDDDDVNVLVRDRARNVRFAPEDSSCMRCALPATTTKRRLCMSALDEYAGQVIATEDKMGILTPLGRLPLALTLFGSIGEDGIDDDEDYDGDDDGHGLVIDEAFDADSLYSSMCLRRAASTSALVEVETEAEAKGRLVLFVGEEVHF